MRGNIPIEQSVDLSRYELSDSLYYIILFARKLTWDFFPAIYFSFILFVCGTGTERPLTEMRLFAEFLS